MASLYGLSLWLVSRMPAAIAIIALRWIPAPQFGDLWFVAKDESA
jgi:hypothetical protein